MGQLWSFANFVPLISVTARRLHDTDRSGWWQVLPLVGIPLMFLGGWTFLANQFPSEIVLMNPVFIIGALTLAGAYILLIIWWATPGTQGANRFGEDPLGRTEADVFD